jgi:hypothetical protein
MGTTSSDLGRLSTPAGRKRSLTSGWRGCASRRRSGTVSFELRRLFPGIIDNAEARECVSLRCGGDGCSVERLASEKIGNAELSRGVDKARRPNAVQQAHHGACR